MRTHDMREQTGAAFALGYLSARLEQRLHEYRARRLSEKLDHLPIGMSSAKQAKREDLRRRLERAMIAAEKARQRAEACERYLDRNNVKR